MKLTQEQKRIKIGEVCGVKPELVCWTAYKDDGDGGSCCMSADTKQEVENWLARLPEGSWAKDYQPKALYRYPDYFHDLNACHEMENHLGDRAVEYREKLSDFLGDYVRLGWAIHAKPELRAEAFGLTLNLWKEGE